jgi:hypothetical protein
MNDYILLMHRDATEAESANDSAAWNHYFTHLRESGSFDGGSAIGDGKSFRKSGQPTAGCEHLSGYIRVRCSSLEEAQAFLAGNPVYESGGTVEIRELPRS